MADTNAALAHRTFMPWRAKDSTRVVAAESSWNKVRQWDRAAEKAGERRRVLCGADVCEQWDGRLTGTSGGTIHDAKKWHSRDGFCELGIHIGQSVITLTDVRRRLFETINTTPHLDWLLPTSNPERCRDLLPDRWFDVHWPANVWIGARVENQEQADARIPALLTVPAAVRFVLLDGMTGPVSLLPWFDPTGACCGNEPEYLCKNCPARADWRFSGPANEHSLNSPEIHLVIVRGQSGPNARPLHPQWVRDVRDQCQAAGVAFTFEQWGHYLPNDLDCLPDGFAAMRHHYKLRPVDGFYSVGSKAAGRVLDGRTWDEMPKAQ